MKVLLVQSWLGPRQGGLADLPVYPVGLACLAASLPGHDVRAFDPNTAADPLPDLARVIAEFAPDVVAVSLRNIDSTNTRVNVSYFKPFTELLAAIEAATDVPLIVGGSGFSMFAGAIMAKVPAIDFGVFLEGEGTFAALLDRLDAPETVPSVHYRRDGELRFSGAGPAVPGAGLPSPDFSILPLGPYLRAPWGVGVETKRGCALACVYCPYGFLNGRAYRLKDPGQVAEELHQLQTEHGLTRFTFLDSVFSQPMDHAAAVCRAMIDRGVTLSWSAWFSERGLTREFLELCRRAGCDTVIFSPDALADPALRALGKALTRAEIEAAFELVADMGSFELSYNFFKNPPGQSLPGFLALLGFVFKARRRLGRRAHFEFNTLRVEPHTRLRDLAIDQGQVDPRDDLLAPAFYSQRRTAYIEKLFNLLLKLAGK